MGDTYLPILKDNKDPHYRYKMPKLTAKVEGSGNGIKTVITNMSAVAKSLGRPPSYPTKYFGCELGAQVSITADQFVVNGAHDAEKLLNLLYGFIRKFVLCSKCNNPETSLIVANGSIRQKCIACGHELVIPRAMHKLTTYIINHPDGGAGVPASGKSSKKADKKGGKKGSGATETNGNATSHSGGGEDQSFVDNDDLACDDFGDGGDDFDDEEFTMDAVSSRIKELQQELGADTNGNGGGSAAPMMMMVAGGGKETANLFYQLVKEKKEAGLLGDASVQKELVKEADRLDLKDKATLILSELLFTENMFDEIKANRILLLRFTNQNPKSQKYLLGGFEKLVGDVYKDKLFANALKILKQLYDEDICDEETIIEWASKESKKYVSKDMSKKIREKVAPFIKWLKEAEVEEGSDDDDQNDDEANKQKSATTTTSTAATSANVKKDHDDEHQNDEDEDDDDDDMFEFSHRVSGLQIKTVEQTPKTAAATGPVNKVEGEVADEDDINIDDI